MVDKIRIAVIFGGRSNEREISFESGRNIINKISNEKYDKTSVFLSSNLDLYKINQRLLVQNSTKEVEQSLEEALASGEVQKLAWDDLPKLFDFVFLGLHGGEGENGTIQGALEMLRVPYNGSGIFTSGLCMTKYQATMYLKSKGFETLNCRLISRVQWATNQAQILAEVVQEIGYPMITKPNDDGCSVMVCKAKNEAELIVNIEQTLLSKSEVLLEQLAPGMELTVGCVGNGVVRALIPTQTVSTGDVLSIEEKFLPGAGLNVTPAPLPDIDMQLVRRKIEQIYMALGCKGYARLDCFYDIVSQKLHVIDVNTLPGMTPATCLFHQAAELGISPSGLLDIIIGLGFEQHHKSNYLVLNSAQEISLMR